MTNATPLIISPFIFLIFILTRAYLFAGVAHLSTKYIEPIKLRSIIPEIKKDSFIYKYLWMAVIVSLDFSLAFALNKIQIINFRPNFNLTNFLITFSIFFIWTEIFFYYSHLAMHHPKLFWIHKHHHQKIQLSPWTSMSFSITERLILQFGVLILPILLSKYYAFSFYALLAYFTTNQALNVFGHLNHEVIPTKAANSLLGKLFLTPTYHALHHLRYKGHYGLFTTVLDRIHKTYFTDYPEQHLKYYTK